MPIKFQESPPSVHIACMQHAVVLFRRAACKRIVSVRLETVPDYKTAMMTSYMCCRNSKIFHKGSQEKCVAVLMLIYQHDFRYNLRT